jgi:hypothetical protein
MKVYRGTLTDAGRRFEFRGLPPARYDLVLATEDRVYEGLTLHRGEDSLTAEDRRMVDEIISRSEPFFNEKTIHRLEGATGKMTGEARAFCTFLRSKKSIGFIDGVWRHEHRRSLKLVLLAQVGPGWQIHRTREIYTTMVAPGRGHTEARYRRALRRVRVTDGVKDLGSLDLRDSSERRGYEPATRGHRADE